MQEIKFRGKDYSGQWVYGDLIHKRHDKEAILIQDERGLGSDVDTTTIGQYTGLKDKNGKEIYGGDVVKCSGVIRLGIVCFYKVAYIVGLAHDTYPLDIILNEFDTYVIGNIHDNPELIKEEEK